MTLKMKCDGHVRQVRKHSPSGPAERASVKTMPGAPRVLSRRPGPKPKRSDNVRMGEAYKMPGRGNLTVGARRANTKLPLATGDVSQSPAMSLAALARGVWEVPPEDAGGFSRVARALMKWWGAVTYEDFERAALKFGFSGASVRVLVEALSAGMDAPAAEGGAGE